MFWEQLQRLFNIDKTLLKFSALVKEVSNVVYWLEKIVGNSQTLLEVAFGLFNVSFPKFKDAEVVKRLGVV